jgi:hypothetical protein
VVKIVENIQFIKRRGIIFQDAERHEIRDAKAKSI